MKLSISISDPVYGKLGAMAEAHDTNTSTVVESALRHFATLPVPERAKVVRETHASKKALTRTGWMSVFWGALADEFGARDPYHGTAEHVYAPRTYGGFSVIFLMNYVGKPDNDRGQLIVHVWDAEKSGGGSAVDTRFSQDDSVYDAARKTAAWIRESKSEARSTVE